ncbi:cytochrome ubiquinol oxidase subunit I [Geitlerinema splendidum]|nr:cytochrome ubiquinol oxidase subunit I [Geitlerinema splendidum]
MEFDPALLARIQFAFTISFHILFPSLTIGLASWLAVVEGLWLKTGNETYRDIYKLWVKIFAVTFGMGVVSGVVMSYQFGTNWSVFSDKTGSVLGPLLAFEVLTAFFLEASFLGVMIFGWDRVTARMHFLSTIIVAVGTVISAFWILSANSWMQTPTGYEIGADNLFLPLNWLDIIFNPSFLYRLFHMVTAAYLTTAFFVGGIGAWYLLKKQHLKQARIMVGMAMLMAIFVSPIQIFLGDLHGLNTLKHQPQKIAAIEAIWDTGKDVPFILVGWPDERTETTHFAVTIPHLTSLLLTHEVEGECRGLKSWPKSERPPILPVFWSFRIMVGIGLLMLLTGFMAVVLYFRNQLFYPKMVSVLVFFHDSIWFYSGACWLVCHRNRASALYCLWTYAHLRGSFSSHRATCFPFSYCLYICLHFCVWCWDLLYR